MGLWAATNFPGSTAKEVSSNAELIANAQLWAKEVVGTDAVSPSTDPLFIAEAFGCKVRYLETGPLVDPLPITFKTPQDVEQMPLPDPTATGRCPFVLAAAARLSQATGGTVPLMGVFEGPFTNACRIVGAEHILRMTRKNVQVVDALLDRVNMFLIELGRALLDNGVNTFFIPEPTASSTMISPGMFRKFVLPRLKQLASHLGVPTILHICGDTNPILAAMGEAGSEAISLDQCMDLSSARAVLPEKVLAGNVDPVESLLMGDPEKVRKNTLHCLHTGGIDRFILMPGCGVPPNAPIDNMKAMVRTAWEYGLGA
jgi:MtaA/CmuA family methyltransferase